MSGPDDDADELQKFLSDLPPNEGYVRVCRRDPLTGKLRLCRNGRLDLASYSPDVVEQKWGGGEFTIEVYDGKGLGARRRFPLVFEGEPRDENPTPPAPAVRPGIEMGPAQSPADLAMAISQAMAQALAPVLGSLERTVQAMSSRPAPASSSPQPSLVELTEALKNLKQLSEPATPPMPAVSPGVGQIKELLQLAKEISGQGSEDDTGPLELLNKAIDKIGVPVVEMIRANQGAVMPGPHPNPRTAPGAPPAMPRPHPLQTYVNMLYASFSAEEPPDNWVGLVLDRVPDDTLKTLLPDPVPELSKIDPRCAAEPFATWLRDLGKQCAEALKDDDTPDPAG